MKHCLLLLLYFCTGAVCAQHEDRIDTTRLRQLGYRFVTICEVKPVDRLNGSDACTPSMRLLFNPVGRLVEKHYVRDTEIGNRFLYRYNAQGQLIESKTHIVPNDSNSVDYRYDAAGNCIEQQVYYRGFKTEKWCFTYNDARQKTAEYRISKAGDTITTYRYTFSGGKPDFETYYTGKQLRFVYRYQYDQWGNETGKKFVKGDMKLAFPSTRFSGPGRAVKHTYYEGERLRVHSTKTVDWEGDRIIREQLIDSAGKVLYTGRFQYNTDGLIHEITTASGLAVNNLDEYYTYDNTGRLITKRSSFNGQDHQRTDYSYDQLGRCTGSKHYYRGNLQEAISYQYRSTSGNPVREARYHLSNAADTVERRFDYTDTICTAVYGISRVRMLPAELFATEPHYPIRELLCKMPPVQLRPDSFSNGAPFWYDTIGKPVKKVVGGDTILLLNLGVYRWMMEDKPQRITVIQRTEIHRNGLLQLTDRDSTGRMHVQVSRLDDGMYELQRLDSYTEIVRPELRKTVAVNQLYKPEIVSISYYNASGLIDSTNTNNAATTTTFRYDNEKRLVEKKVHYSSNFVSTTLYAYDANGQLVRETLFSTDGSISNDRHYTYVHKQLKQVTSSMPAPVQTYRFYYDK